MPTVQTDDYPSGVSPYKRGNMGTSILFWHTNDSTSDVWLTYVVHTESLLYSLVLASGLLPHGVYIWAFQTILSQPPAISGPLTNLLTLPSGNDAQWYSTVEQTEFTGQFFGNPKNKAADATLLYAHGGAFVVGSSKMYSEFYRELVETYQTVNKKNLDILTVDYTLAPEATLPRQIEQVFAAYKYLRKTRGENHPIFIDPSTYPEGSWTDPANKDDIITLDFLRHGVKACGPTAAASELDNSKLSTLGPAFITFGGKERLKDLILRFSDSFPERRIVELKEGLHNWLVKKELAPPAKAVQSQRNEYVKALTSWMNDLADVKAS
ncbi:hypothetical protein LTS18_010383 [Coniosporium uncinatum]|uniref:Uncharacterized protein n=1 Tax=Coniosporium uncinatum TaxID=93489 RepID=A0ACC3DYL2_9PEZI|nr:hypothetical protein LTS18_010383 [Coniosporium uncinatum]